MKRTILSSLFSTVLVFGGGSVTAFADGLGPTDPAAPPTIESTGSSEPMNPTEPIGPAEPPVIPADPTEPSKPTEPTTPSEPEKPTKLITPADPGTLVEPIEPGEPIEPSQLTEPTTPSEPKKLVTPEQPKELTQPVIPEKPAEPEAPKAPEQPTKPIDVVITSSGEIGKTNQLTGIRPGTPTEIGDLAEVIRVPSEATPITTEAGEGIVAVSRGVPLAKTPEGLEPVSSLYKVLLSGNIGIEASDGRMKVLPHTGEKFTLLFSVLGSFFVSISGFFSSKKNKKRA